LCSEKLDKTNILQLLSRHMEIHWDYWIVQYRKIWPQISRSNKMCKGSIFGNARNLAAMLWFEKHLNQLFHPFYQHYSSILVYDFLQPLNFSFYWTVRNISCAFWNHNIEHMFWKIGRDFDITHFDLCVKFW
jgi:hypothetical protein